MLKIVKIMTDLREEPLALESAHPAFSYTVTSERAGDRQLARRLAVTLDGRIVFDTGRVLSQESLHIPYEGEPLLPYRRYRVHITVWSEGGDVAKREACFTTGPLGTLSAEWIAPCDSCLPYRAYRLKKSFCLKRKPRAALLYITATNFFDVYLNGERPDERRFSPATGPEDRRLYESYDLTSLMAEGENTLGLILADGYYKPSFLWRYDTWQHEGIRRVLGLLHLTYEDGTVEVIPTDGTWLAADEPALLENSIYHGEHYDARLAKPWCHARSEGYHSVLTVPVEGETILPSPLPPILVEEYRDFTEARRLADGRVILDFGQNMSGFVRIERVGKRGERLTLRHAEMIDRESGELDTRNLRDAKQTDVYIFGEDGRSVYEPRFTYHGFRYVEITGLSEIPEKGEFRAAFLHAALEKTMDFSCDDTRIMKLYRNATYSIRSNTMSYSSDCAGRDERTPCAMDLAAYIDFASQYWHVHAHSGLMLRQIAKQDPSDSTWESAGVRSDVGAPEWDGAVILVLRALFRAYGDRRLLLSLYPTARAYLLAMAAATTEGVHPGRFGDWCAPHPNRQGLFRDSFSHPSETATALLYHLADAMCELARAAEKEEDLPKYRAIMEAVKEGYHAAFYHKESFIYSDGDQAPCVLPLAFGMAPEEDREAIFSALLRTISKKREGHLDTGIFGTRYLATVLADHGHLDNALDILFHPTYPSFGDQIARGATTLWEQWVEVGSMATHNHAMFAGVCSFITEKLFGLVTSENAYRTVTLRPVLAASVNELSFTLRTLRGNYKMSYRKAEDTLTLSLDVPFGCHATLILPNGQEYRLASGRHTLSV